MKTLILLLTLLSLTNTYAGNGVVVGDGHPTETTKQERLSSTSVDAEFEKLIERLMILDPMMARMMNVGLRGIKEKKIILVKILEASNDHYAFIEDARINYNNGSIDLVSQPTIYFYENYFTLQNENKDHPEEVSKLKVLIHELLHVYLGDSELKVQRVTDLVYKISTGQFEKEDLDNLVLETTLIRKKISRDDPNYQPYQYYDVLGGVRFLDIYNGTYDRVSAPLLSDEFIASYDSMSNYAQSIFRTNVQIFSQRLWSTEKKTPARYSLIGINELDFRQIQIAQFFNFMLKNFGDNIIKDEFLKNWSPTSLQQDELKQATVPVYNGLTAYITLLGVKGKNPQIEALVFKGGSSQIKLTNKSFLKTEDFSNAETIKVLYIYMKKLFTKFNEGTVTTVEQATFARNLTLPMPIASGKIEFRQLVLRQNLYITSHGNISYDTESIIKNFSAFTITPKSISISSDATKIQVNSFPNKPLDIDTWLSIPAEVTE